MGRPGISEMIQCLQELHYILYEIKSLYSHQHASAEGKWNAPEAHGEPARMDPQ